MSPSSLQAPLSPPFVTKQKKAPPSPLCNRRSREVPKLRIEAKKQEKQSLEAISRRTSHKNPFRPILAQFNASPTLSLFHNDPYMKVMHAYYAKESPIPPPTIVPPSSMLSPMFNPQEFFLPEELLPLKKRGHDRSSSSTSVLPQAFEIGESSRKTSLERHKEQIEEILNHLDELSL
ncbi:hypothetical protein Tco_0791957 [Tanacetum coccineum]